MKKVVISVLCILVMMSMPVCYAEHDTVVTNNEEKQGTEQLVEIKKTSEKKLEDYKQEYGSDAYGLAAYILNIVRIYSIPFCFIGIAIAAIYQYIIGVRKIDVRDRGLQLMIGFITIFVICQVLPLIFAIVVKGWRG